MEEYKVRKAKGIDHTPEVEFIPEGNSHPTSLFADISAGLVGPDPEVETAHSHEQCESSLAIAVVQEELHGLPFPLRLSRCRPDMQQQRSQRVTNTTTKAVARRLKLFRMHQLLLFWVVSF